MDILICIVVVALLLAGTLGWSLLLDGRSGERYLRRRAQGPYVPLTPEPADADADRPS